MPLSFEWSLPFRFSDQNFVCVSDLPHACYITRPSRPSWFNHPNNIYWSLQVMKLLIMQSSPVSHNFLPLRCNYFPDHPVLLLLIGN
jgi:hypothetical protein